MNDFNKIIEESRCSIEKADLRVLLPVLAAIKPEHVLEIGTWKGYSAELWWKALLPYQIVTVEKGTREELFDATTTGRTSLLYGHDSHDPQTLEEVKRLLQGKEVDFLFIDGDHSYDGVKNDFEMYSPLVRKGGIIAFHDALYHADKTEEVDLYWDYRFRKQYPYLEIKVGENSTGIGVIFV